MAARLHAETVNFFERFTDHGMLSWMFKVRTLFHVLLQIKKMHKLKRIRIKHNTRFEK